MNQHHVELLIEESSVRSFAQYVQRAKHRAEQAQEDYAEAVRAYEEMSRVLRNKIDNYYYGK